MDRETARTEVRRRAGISRETARYPSAEVDSYINVSNRKLHSILMRYGLVRDEALQTIVANGSATYPLDAAHFKTLAVWRDTGSNYPQPLDRHTFMDHPMGSPVAQTGLASSYRIAKTAGVRAIELHPRPQSGTYYVGYVAKLADLAADTDELVSALGYDDEFIILDAAIRCLRKDGTPTKGLEMDRAEVLGQIVEDAKSQEEGEYHSIRDTRSDCNSLWDQLSSAYLERIGGLY